jgi:hypothetical protein
MTVPIIAVPPGSQHVVGLLLTNPTVGDPSFQPGSIGEASTGSFSSLLPVYPTTLEGPTSNGNVTRFLVGVNNSETQEIAFAGSGNGVGMLMVAAANYAYNPALLAFGNRQLIRGTGGNLVTANPLYSEGAATSDDGERGGQDVRAFLYAVDDATPAQAVRLRASAAGSLITSAGAAQAPPTLTTAADVILGTIAPSSLFAQNNDRVQAIIQSLATNTDQVRIGENQINSTRGIELSPGDSVTLATTAQIFGRAVTGAPQVTRTEITA